MPHLLIGIIILAIMLFLGIELALDPIRDIFEEEEAINQHKCQKNFHRKLQRFAYNTYLILNFIHLACLWINWKHNLKHM